jgi:nucleotide-binding universal stress UspA family protein
MEGAVMFRASKVLVATDLGESADEPIRQAHEWARAAGGQLIACHIVPDFVRSHPLFPQEGMEDMSQVLDREHQAAEAVSERVMRVTGRKPEELEVMIGSGAPAPGILARAEEAGADLIVVGSHSATRLERFLLGSVAERVVRYAHCPVLVARPQVPAGAILAATDFSDSADQAVMAAAQAARWFGGPLKILHSVDVFIPPVIGWGVPLAASWAPLPEGTVKQVRAAAATNLAEMLRRLKVEGDPIVAEGRADEAIVRAAEELPAKLIVVGTQGRTGISRIVLGSVAEAVLRAAPSPVLVTRSTAGS